MSNNFQQFTTQICVGFKKLSASGRYTEFKVIEQGGDSEALIMLTKHQDDLTWDLTTFIDESEFKARLGAKVHAKYKEALALQSEGERLMTEAKANWINSVSIVNGRRSNLHTVNDPLKIKETFSFSIQYNKVFFTDILEGLLRAEKHGDRDMIVDFVIKSHLHSREMTAVSVLDIEIWDKLIGLSKAMIDMIGQGMDTPEKINVFTDVSLRWLSVFKAANIFNDEPLPVRSPQVV